ncbi:MAG: hypothetical protein M1351_05340 [Candidatus Thermoplasmatota archaeon]|jgi:hypothetical protein|nr:hypothetical protein [Candidatus Thermoplasmatota archaeon]
MNKADIFSLETLSEKDIELSNCRLSWLKLNMTAFDPDSPMHSRDAAERALPVSVFFKSRGEKT